MIVYSVLSHVIPRMPIIHTLLCRHPVEGKHVLIVEDIIDTGHTLAKLHEMFRDRKAASVKTAVLCRKKECVEV